MEKKYGVYICKGCGIGESIDIEKLAKVAKKGPIKEENIKVHDVLCSPEGLQLIKGDTKKEGINTILIAACSPRLHEPTFRAMVQRAGLNPYLLEISNIREHCSWVHDDGETATAKAKDLVHMAIERARLLVAQETMTVPVRQTALVVGGGIAGIQASLDMADAGYQVYLVEKEPSIGGMMAKIDKTFPTMDCSI